MNLLILTQKVDSSDPILGFFHRWIVEFSKHFDSVIILCLYKGEYNLPSNVRVISLGKEKSESKIKYIKNFYKSIWKERRNYDKVFVHMNPIYILLGGMIWRFLKKDVYLWYTHKSVDLKLKIAEKFVKYIFTASSKSFRLKSDKVIVTGHGIDLSEFLNKESSRNSDFTILTLGRISKTKNQLILVSVMKRLRDLSFKSKLIIVGDAVTSLDSDYKGLIIKEIKALNLTDTIDMVGSVKPSDVYEYYRKSDLFINLSNTGSLDKAVLEAMASKVKVLTSNVAFKEILPELNFTTNDPVVISDKIIKLSTMDLDESQFQYVCKNHEITSLLNKITDKMR